MQKVSTPDEPTALLVQSSVQNIPPVRSYYALYSAISALSWGESIILSSTGIN